MQGLFEREGIQKMKIALITGEFPPKWGGIGSHCYNLANTLADFGHEIHVVTRKIRGDNPLLNKNIFLHLVKYIPLPVIFTKSTGENCIKYFIKNIEADVVHLQYQMISVPEKYFKKIEKPTVSTFHGSWKGEREALKHASLKEMNINDFAVKYISSYFQKYELIGIENSDEKISITNFSVNELCSYTKGISADDFHVIPNGVDTDTFSPGNREIDGDKIKILFVGRFAGRKGIYDLLKAFEIVNERRKDVELYLVGRGSLDIKMKNVRIFEGIPVKDLVTMYANSDIFVLPSYYEAQGIVLLEAMASGLPCVATNVGGIPETVIDGSNGILVEPRNPQKLAEALLMLIEDEKLRRKYGEEGRKRAVEHYDWKIIAKRTEKIYSNLT